MQNLLTDIRFRYWPVNSIAYYALRNNLVTASLSTWYNCMHKLGISRPRIPKKYGKSNYRKLRGSYTSVVAILQHEIPISLWDLRGKYQGSASSELLHGLDCGLAEGYLG